MQQSLGAQGEDEAGLFGRLLQAFGRIDRAEFIAGEDLVDIKDDDKVLALLPHTADEFASEFHPHARWWLDLLGGEIEDFAHRIGEGADDDPLPIEINLEDNDAAFLIEGSMPNLQRRSTTGTTLPRRLMTPSI